MMPLLALEHSLLRTFPTGGGHGEQAEENPGDRSGIGGTDRSATGNPGGAGRRYRAEQQLRGQAVQPSDVITGHVDNLNPQFFTPDPVDFFQYSGLQPGSFFDVFVELTDPNDNGKLLAHQAQALSSLVAHAHRTVPFHRDRIEASGLGRGRSLDLEGWRRLPVLTRRDLQRRRPCPTAST